MPKPKTLLVAFTILLSACTLNAVIHTPADEISPNPTPTAGTENTPERLWIFRPEKEDHTYHSITRVVIQPDAQPTTVSQKTLTITSQITIRNQQTKPGVAVGQITNVTITNGDQIDRTSQHLPAVNFQNSITANGFDLGLSLESSSPEAEACENPPNTILGEARTHMIIFPLELRSNSNWTDTLSTTGCSGPNLPSKFKTIRTYKVLGEITHSEKRSLLIIRSEVSNFEAFGRQDHHQLNLTGHSTGRSNIYLDPGAGTVLEIEAHQEITLMLISLEKEEPFREIVDQKTTLIR